MIIAEISKFGVQHVGYNAAMISVMKKVDPEDDIEFWGEKEHISYLQKKIDPQVLGKAKVVKVIDPSGTILWLRKLSGETLLALRLLAYAHKTRQLIVFLSLFPSTLLVLKWAQRYYKMARVMVCLHGELEYLRTSSADPRLKMFRLSMRKALLLKRSNFMLVLQGEVIWNNLSAILPVKREGFLVINHPFLFEEKGSQIAAVGHQGLVISHIGRADMVKKAYMIFELGKRLSAFVVKGLLRLRLVGPVSSEVQTYGNEWVEYARSAEVWSMLAFSQGVASSDYLLFFYDNESYKLCSSGAIFEAFFHLKPVVSIRNDYFEYIFSQVGPIGYLVDDMDQMEAKLRALLYEQPENYDHFTENIIKGREWFSPRVVASDIKSQFLKIGWKSPL